MGEQRISPGTAGPVSTVCVDEGSKRGGSRRAAVYRSRVRVRLHSGELVQIERRKDTKKGAETAVNKAVAERLSADQQAGASRRTTTLKASAEAWMEEVEHDSRLTHSSRRVYLLLCRRHVVNSHLKARQMRSITAGDIEDLLRSIGKPGSAKTARTVLSKIWARSVRRGECGRNVVRDCEPVGIAKAETERDTERALTADEVWRLLTYAYRTPSYRRRGTADLCAFMLSTGLRIGEALAITAPDLNDQLGILSARGTVVRVKGRGLVKTRPKTLSSDRQIPLHPRTVAQAKRLFGDGRHILFPSRRGTFRDPSNTNRDVVRLLAECQLDWATSHTFRRTLLTKLGDRGVPLRLIADLAGHANAAMTARKYLGRRGPDEQLRKAL